MASLLLDSSNTSLSVGFEKDGKLLCFTSYEAWQIQSEHMVPEIDKLMEKYGLTRRDISKVITSIGPGSYTGVRIALTIAKIVSLACKCLIFPVSSLRVLKDFDNPSICVINARSGRSYFGVFKGKEVVEVDQIKTNDEVMEYIKNHPDYKVCGDARYLGLEKVDTNISEQMISLMDVLKPTDNDLGVKPVYMKDQYEVLKH